MNFLQGHKNIFRYAKLSKSTAHYQKSLGRHSFFVCNNNWTEWSTIQGVIGQVISKSLKF